MPKRPRKSTQERVNRLLTNQWRLGRLESVPAELTLPQLYRLVEIADTTLSSDIRRYAMLLLERALCPPVPISLAEDR